MRTPSSPGIYIARLRTEEPVPVTSDPRWVETCAKVSRENVKVGKARSFAVRERQFWGDFGRENVDFIPVARTNRIVNAEKAVLKALHHHRKRSPKGALMDWLKGITASEAITPILSALAA